MKIKNIHIGTEARDILLSGIDSLYKVVSPTLGPGGRNIVIKTVNGVATTRDGVTVAKFFGSHNIGEFAGAELLTNVAKAANNEAGDGTTTATVLAYHMLVKSLESSTGNKQLIKKGMETACEQVAKALKKNAKKVTIKNKGVIKSVAKISASDDEIGAQVAEAYFRAGEGGIVTLEAVQNSTKTVIEATGGLTISGGFTSESFINNHSKRNCLIVKPRVLVIQQMISSAHHILEILNSFQMKFPNESLVIFCDGIDGEAKDLIVANVARGSLKICVVIPRPSSGGTLHEEYSDIASFTGAEFIQDSAAIKLSAITAEMYGTANSFEATEKETRLVFDPANQDRLNSYIESLNSLELEDKEVIDRTKSRVSRLQGKASIIKVGGSSHVDITERFLRYEDSVNAVKAALSEGVIPGGGCELYRIASDLQSKWSNDNKYITRGANILFDACRAPFDIITTNYYNNTVDPRALWEENQLDTPGTVYSYPDERANNYLKEKVIDPVKVVISSLSAATAICSVITLTEGLIVDDLDYLSKQ